MIPRTDHVRLLGSDGGHLIIVAVQQLLVHLVPLGDINCRQEALNLLLEPVIGVGNVARYPDDQLAGSLTNTRRERRHTVPQEVGISTLRLKRLHGVVIMGSQRVSSALSNMRSESVGAHHA